jgi:hypothetical protein
MASLGDVWARLTGRSPGGQDNGPAIPRVPTSQDILDAVAQVEALVAGGKVPGPVAFRVARVIKVVRATIPRLDTLGAGSEQAHVVISTATSYLPEALGGYLRLPREWADRRPIEGGKTALMLLIDQLDLLAATMDDISDAVYRADAAALIAHGAFLQEKFGAASGGGALDLGATS